MTLLIDVLNESWMTPLDLRQELTQLKESSIRLYPDLGNASEITMIATDRLRPGLVARLPSLKLVQKLGAGVDTMVKDPDLPAGVRITRVRTDVTAMEMARYCLGYVLHDVHNIEFHRQEQVAHRWAPIPPKRVSDLCVGVLGLGQIGGSCAKLFVECGFSVMGWSRSSKSRPGVTCLDGREGLGVLLSAADYVVSVLPATAETDNLFGYDQFSMMKPTAMLINVGRGTLIVEDDLVRALDDGKLRHAVLDVCRTEPLAEDNPMWNHPGVTITPHVSGWDVDDGFKVVAENYLRLTEGRELLNEVDRLAGY